MKEEFYEKLKKLAKGKVPSQADIEFKSNVDKLMFFMQGTWPLLKYVFWHSIWRFIRYRSIFFIERLIYYALIIVLGYYAVNKVAGPIIYKNNPGRNEVKEIYIAELRPFSEYIKKAAYRESGCNYDTVSVNGMLGAYQFDPATLKALGYDGSIKYFLSDSSLQDSYFKILLMKNKKTYKNYIDKFSNKKMDGVRGVVTESGILMAFHLKPADAVSFFNGNGIGKGDANGTTVVDYIELFSGYDIPF